MLNARFLLFLILLLPGYAWAMRISGNVTDASDLNGLPNVSIINIHNNATALTTEDGNFHIEVERGQLLEFRKMGYKTLRIRIPAGDIPAFFKVLMQQGPVELPEFALSGQTRNWKKDSLRNHQLYREALELPRLTGLDVINHPFSALSKKNRMAWAFQKEYNYWEQQKYVDYTFNESLVTQLTGLQGDSLNRYMRQYRPSYEQLRSMNEYTFYSFVKQTVTSFRVGRQYRPSIRRSAN